MYAPITVIRFAQVTGSYTAAASLLAVKMLSSAAFEVPTGVLSERLGRRGTMIAGAVVMVAAPLGYAGASGYGLLLAAVVLEGSATSLWSCNNESSDAPHQRRCRADGAADPVPSAAVAAPHDPLTASAGPS